MSAEPPPPPAVIVELCGLPGAGKTSLSRAIGGGRAGFAVARPNRTVAPDIPDVPRIARKLALVAEEALRRRTFELEMAHLIVRSRQPGLGGAAARWVQWASTQALMRRTRDVPGVHLFDEGVLQALWSLALRGDPTATLRALGASVGRWSSPDLVFVVDPPVELVARRLIDRRSTHSRLQPSTDDAAFRAELVRGRAIFDRLLSWWEQTLPSEVPIVRLGGSHADPSADVRVMTTSIDAVVRRLGAGRPTPAGTAAGDRS